MDAARHNHYPRLVPVARITDPEISIIDPSIAIARAGGVCILNGR
jgi:hypothetical protein